MTVPISSALLPTFCAEKSGMTPAAVANLNAARLQLKQQYSTEYASFGADLNTADAWLDAVLVLELAADLHEKEEMLIYDFVADTSLLAGNQLAAFEGFFDIKYRKHDYDYGRSVGQRQLAFYKNQATGVFANLRWTPKPIDPIDPELNNIQMSQVDRTLRERVYSQLSDAANQLLEELNVNVFIRKPAMWFFIQGEIKKLLAL
jgi:hypothetical protein